MLTILCRPRVLSHLAFCLIVAVFLLAESCGSQISSPPVSPVSPTPPASCVGATTDFCRNVTVNGTSRYYLLHVPTNYQANSGALVVVLHGSGGDGAQIESYSQMSSKADATGFAVAYPYGLVAPSAGSTEWHNYFDDSIWAPQTPPDDIAFMRMLVSAVEAEIHPDAKKVYFAGISNGALFAHRVGIEMSDVVAAVGIVEGTLFGFSGNLQGIPPAVAPVSVQIFHGDADSVIPYCAQQGVASQEVTFNYWIQTAANDCTALDSSLPLCDAQGNITSLDEKDGAGCNGGVEVKIYRLIGGVHAWYSTAMNVPGQVPYNPDFDSTTGTTTNDILWNFFAAHPKP
jgi:polyhydroxybutyrate depolymerase